MERRVYVLPIVGELFLIRKEPYLNVDTIWTLAGGHIEEGENLIAAMERELREETGFQGDYEILYSSVFKESKVSPNEIYFFIIKLIDGGFSFPETDGSWEEQVSKNYLVDIEELLTLEGDVLLELAKLAVQNVF